MGWREIRGYLREAQRRHRETESDPESWRGAENDPGWQAMHRKREALRGR